MVYGFLSKFDGKSFLIEDGIYRISENDDYYGTEYLESMDFYIVASDTVGQCIGITDKNGKEIYEGDVFKQFADCTESGTSLYYFYVIEWNEEYCAFVGREIHSSETYLMPDLEDIEIIGNVYENAYLLRGGGE